MWTVTDRFLTTLRGAHQIVVSVDVLDGGEVVVGDIPVSGGSIIRDRMAAQYGRLSIDIADEALAPLGPADQLGPAGFELAVSRGIRFPDGTTELVPLGVFGIQDSTVDDETMTTRIEAADRSQKVADARLERDRSFGPAADPDDIAVTLVTEVFPDLDYTVSAPDMEPVGLVTYNAEADRWQTVIDVFKACGCEVFFDELGRLVIRDEPDVRTTDPVWTIEEGEGGVLVSVDLSWSRRPTHNRAIVTGTNTEFGVTYRGQATDSAATSPSQYGGRFGAKPLFYFSSHVTSNAGALRAAKAILKSKQGIAMSLDLSAVPNPALQPGDVVTVARERLGLDNLAVIVDAITLGLGPEDPMTCEVRARQDEDIEEA